MPRDRLSYDTWTSILPEKATPPQAQTDLPLGKARIPNNWPLGLVLTFAILLCLVGHNLGHLAHSILTQSTLITKHHRIAPIFWLWMRMATSSRCEECYDLNCGSCMPIWRARTPAILLWTMRPVTSAAFDTNKTNPDTLLTNPAPTYVCLA